MSNSGLIKENPQEPDSWTGVWSGRNVIDELCLRDCYGERGFVLKYVPRSGKILEAGSGLGRIVFHLNEMNLDTIGIDFSKKDISQCRAYSKKLGLEPKKFIYGNILDLPFKNDEISCYLSFGVVEHFIEGPQEPIKEAYRVLRPGGVLLITTPNKYAIHRLYGILRNGLKLQIKKSLNFLKGRKYSPPKEEFWQYWYSKEQLKFFAEEQGFETITIDNFGLKHALDWLLRSSEFRIFKPISVAIFKIADLLSNTFLNNFAGNSIIVAKKPGHEEHCFVYGDKVSGNEIAKGQLPFSNKCYNNIPNNVLKSYLNKTTPFFSNSIINPQGAIQSSESICSYCQNMFASSKFVDLSFTQSVCKSCLGKKEINLELSNFNLEEKWMKWK